MKKLSFEPEYITSRTNKTVVSLAKLCDKKYRDEYGLFLAEGEKLTEEAVAFSSPEYVLISESAFDSISERIKAVVEKAHDAGTRVLLLSDEAFEKVSTEHSPQGIISVIRSDSLELRPLFGADGKPAFSGKTIILDSVRDPGNLGTILRAAASFGFEGVILHDSADITNPKTVRASMGAVFKVGFAVSLSLADDIDMLKSSGRRVVAAALAADSFDLAHGKLAAEDIVVIGNEGHGIADDIIGRCSATVKIPMAEGTESLNASIAASIIMWEQYTS